MSTITDVISNFPSNLQDPVLQLWNAFKDELGVKREDFSELKKIVEELAQSQNRTGLRVEELVQAQNRTELRVEELAQAQNRTELRVEELAQAQNRTELRVEELAQAQKETTLSIKQLSDTIDFKIGGLGRRWGIDSERSFRNGLAEILSETGYKVINYVKDDTDGIVFGHSAVIEIDVIVKGDRVIVVEIKSSIGSNDIYIFMKKAEFYSNVSGQNVDKLLMITPYIDDAARDIAEKFEVIICDSLSDIEQSIKKA